MARGTPISRSEAFKRNPQLRENYIARNEGRAPKIQKGKEVIKMAKVKRISAREGKLRKAVATHLSKTYGLKTKSAPVRSRGKKSTRAVSVGSGGG